jgi:nicotinate-nucleotide adenylyltransferase
MEHPNRDSILNMLRSRLSPERLLHTLGVEAAAVCLAQRWNADVGTARNAALLHDITKEERNQLQMMEGYGILPEETVKTVPNVYHAMTAAAFAREMGFCGDTVSAIRWHTTGRAGMTVLEKILYLADKTEPFRPRYTEYAEIKRLGFYNLDRALALALKAIMKWNEKWGEPVEHNSVRALEWLECQNAYSSVKTK